MQSYMRPVDPLMHTCMIKKKVDESLNLDLVLWDELSFTSSIRRMCTFTLDCSACEKTVPGMVFHLNLRAGPSILRNLKTIPFLSKAIKTCIQLYKEFPDPKAKYGVRYSYYQSGWCGLESNVQDETVACSEKAEKKRSDFPFPVEKWTWSLVLKRYFPQKHSEN